MSAASSPTSGPNLSTLKGIGDDLWKKSEKINSEVYSLVYGCYVQQILQKEVVDRETVSLAMDTVHQRLDKLGYHMGTRLVDDFYARCLTQSPLTVSLEQPCKNLKEAMTVISKVACKMYFGISAKLSDWKEDETQVTLSLEKAQNALIQDIGIVFPALCDILENSNEKDDFYYCQMYCGLLRGALEMVQIPVTCQLLKSDQPGTMEIRISLK